MPTQTNDWRAYLSNEFHRWNTMTRAQLQTRLKRIRKPPKMGAFLHVAHARDEMDLFDAGVDHAEDMDIHLCMEIRELVRRRGAELVELHRDQSTAAIRDEDLQELVRVRLSLQQLEAERERHRQEYKEREARRNPVYRGRVRKIRFKGDK